MSGIKKKITLVQTLLKYSDNFIIKNINTGKSKIQVAPEYQKDPIKLANLKKELTVKLAELRDACTDLDNPKNRQIALNFMSYFNGPDKKNAQFRGIQSQLANEIYENVSVASGVDLTKYHHELSAEAFSQQVTLNNKYLTHVPRLQFPKSFSLANPQSLKNGNELITAKVHSAITGFKNIMTDDQPIIHSNTTKITIKNHNQTNNDFDSETDVSIVKNDVKTIPIYKINENNGNIVSVGAVGEAIVKQKVQYLGSIALNTVNLSKIKHVDPSKNTVVEKTKILQKVMAAGDPSEAKNLINFTMIIDTKYTSENE